MTHVIESSLAHSASLVAEVEVVNRLSPPQVLTRCCWTVLDLLRLLPLLSVLTPDTFFRAFWTVFFSSGSSDFGSFLLYIVSIHSLFCFLILFMFNVVVFVEIQHCVLFLEHVLVFLKKLHVLLVLRFVLSS